MKKIKLLLAVCFLSSSILNSQTITGKVMDLETADILPFANISVYKSDSLIKVVNSDLDGNYNLELTEPGIYRFETTYLGYEDFAGELQVPYTKEGSDLLLAPSAHMLDIIEIVANNLSDCKVVCGLPLYSTICTSCGTVATVSDSENEISYDYKELNSTIYPNPSSQFFKIRNQGQYNKMAIANMQGQWLIQAPLKDEIDNVSLGNLISGTYVVLLFKPNGEVDSEKLVVMDN